MGSYHVKINKSLLHSGKITIPNDEINSLIDVSNWSPGECIDIKLKLKEKIYEGKIAYKCRNASNEQSNPYYQLSYKKDLIKDLKKEFVHTFLAIEDEKMNYRKDNKYHITTENFNREVLQFKSNMDGIIELIPFLKIQTEYDNIFKTIIEMNLLNFDEASDSSKKEDIIQYSSPWIPIEELWNHKSITNAVYYLADTINKEIYIGVCDELGTRVKPNRKEIPNWNFFRYETIKMQYWDIKGRIEDHSIRAFASFFENGANEPFLKVSDYKLKNQNWAKRK